MPPVLNVGELVVVVEVVGLEVTLTLVGAFVVTFVGDAVVALLGLFVVTFIVGLFVTRLVGDLVVVAGVGGFVVGALVVDGG